MTDDERETRRLLESIKFQERKRTRRQVIEWLRARGARFHHDAAGCEPAHVSFAIPTPSLRQTLTDMGTALLAAADDLEDSKDP